MYEDRQQFEKARQCYQRILDAYPNEPRARLFLKDTQASSDMVYDEDAQRRRDRLSQLLGIPVTDFELSVRSRNCLQKMGIMTLGDLTRTTEQELLASKNFGETSLNEIKEMMASKGLELGQLAHEKARVEVDARNRNRSAPTSKPCSASHRRSEPVGSSSQVHGSLEHHDRRRVGSPHRRRTARVQELRRDEPERSSRKADASRPQAPRRLIRVRTDFADRNIQRALP